MTEAEKKVLKYWNILRCMMISDYSVIAEHRYSSIDFASAFSQAVKCAIAEVEAVEKALEEYGSIALELQNMESNFRFLQEELTELKQLL